MGIYRTAEVCLAGHTTTSSIETSPESRSQYCPECGEKTISACPSCGNNIRGYYELVGVISISEYVPPNYCFHCGSRFPWAESKISAAKELIEEIDELSIEERDLLKQSVVELTTDTPKTELASFRYKKLLKKSGEVSGNTLNRIVVSIATEAAKNLLGLS